MLRSSSLLRRLVHSSSRLQVGAIECTRPAMLPEAATEEKPPGDGQKGVKTPKPASELVQMMHNELVETLRKKDFFPNKQLYEMFDACTNLADVNLAMHVLDRLHRARASNLKQFEPFNTEVLSVVAKAFTRVKSPKAALDVFTKYNTYGLYPHINASHELLKYAAETNDVKFTRKVLKNMLDNSIKPTAVTAQIIMGQCAKMRSIGTLLLIAKEFHANGIEMFPATYDVCLAAAANSGRLQMLEEIQQWMQHYNIRTSPSASLSFAKARLLKGKPDEAAKLLIQSAKDSKTLKTHVSWMVRLWPGELAMSHTGSKKSAHSCMLKTKQSLGEMLQCLKKQGHPVEIDLEAEFGTGPGQGDKWEHCFGDRAAATTTA